MNGVTSHSEDELMYLSIEQAARLLRRKEISPVELVDLSLDRIERLNPSLNAFLTVAARRARRQALRRRRSNSRWMDASPAFSREQKAQRHCRAT